MLMGPCGHRLITLHLGILGIGMGVEEATLIDTEDRGEEDDQEDGGVKKDFIYLY
jgi:hypothetical protein